MKISARNVLTGRVIEVEEGLTTAKVKLDIGGGNTITSIITKESLLELDIKVGEEASAIIKSTDVIIGK
jgi:molybdopterin-binding protein